MGFFGKTNLFLHLVQGKIFSVPWNGILRLGILSQSHDFRSKVALDSPNLFSTKLKNTSFIYPGMELVSWRKLWKAYEIGSKYYRRMDQVAGVTGKHDSNTRKFIIDIDALNVIRVITFHEVDYPKSWWKSCQGSETKSYRYSENLTTTFNWILKLRKFNFFDERGRSFFRNVITKRNLLFQRQI